MVQGTENSVELNYLNSLTEYQVAVFAIYRSSASEALRGSATTCKFICLQGYNEDMGEFLEDIQVVLEIQRGVALAWTRSGKRALN